MSSVCVETEVEDAFEVVNIVAVARRNNHQARR